MSHDTIKFNSNIFNNRRLLLNALSLSLSVACFLLARCQLETLSCRTWLNADYVLIWKTKNFCVRIAKYMRQKERWYHAIFFLYIWQWKKKQTTVHLYKIRLDTKNVRAWKSGGDGFDLHEIGSASRIRHVRLARARLEQGTAFARSTNRRTISLFKIYFLNIYICKKTNVSGLRPQHITNWLIQSCTITD